MKRLYCVDSKFPDAIIYKWQLEDLVFGNRRGRRCDHCGRLFAPGSIVYKDMGEDQFYHWECLKLHRENKEWKHKEAVKKVLCDMKGKKTSEELTAMLATIYNGIDIKDAELFETVKMEDGSELKVYHYKRFATTSNGKSYVDSYCVLSKERNIKSDSDFYLLGVGRMCRIIKLLDVNLRENPVDFYKKKFTHMRFEAAMDGKESELPQSTPNDNFDVDKYLGYITYLCPDL